MSLLFAFAGVLRHWGQLIALAPDGADRSEPGSRLSGSGHLVRSNRLKGQTDDLKDQQFGALTVVRRAYLWESCELIKVVWQVGQPSGAQGRRRQSGLLNFNHGLCEVRVFFSPRSEYW